MTIEKIIDKKSRAKIRICTIKVPMLFYTVMLENAKEKGMTKTDNDLSYLNLMVKKTKYYKTICSNSKPIDNDYMIITIIYEKLTNKKSLYLVD